MNGIVYLDNAATTFPKDEAVYERMNYVNRNLAVNAGRGSYALAKEASAIITDVRKRILELANANQVAEVVLTTSATAACNQILGGMDWHAGDVVYYSPYEHNAIMRTLHYNQQKYDLELVEIPLLPKDNSTGCSWKVDLEKLQYLFTQKPPAYLCITQISNVTGYILPVNEIIELAKEYHPCVIVDAAQSFGLIKTDFTKQNIDYLIFAGHKSLYGPLGVAGFIKRNGTSLKPYFVGGTGSDSLNLNMPEGDESQYEAGSHNIVAIAGLQAALEVLPETEGLLEKEQELTRYVVTELKKIRDVILYIPEDESRHVGIVSFNINGFKASEVGMILDQDYQIAVRTGYHCTPKIHDWIGDKEFAGTVRVGIGRFTTMEDVEKLVEAVKEIVRG